jgi:hypothetical protein
MQKHTMHETNAARLADAALAASRQVWLAGLGAAAVTRHWAKNDAGNTLRALVRQGSAVETQALRVFGNGVGTSIASASWIWNRTREQVRATVSALAGSAAAALPQFGTPVAPSRKSRITKPRKATKARASTRAKRVTRRTRKASGKTS